MLASRKSKSVCLVCNGTGLLTKTKKSKSRHNPADLCPNCVGSGALSNPTVATRSTGISQKAVVGLSLLGALSLGGLAIYLTRKKETEKVAPEATSTKSPETAGNTSPENEDVHSTPTSDEPTSTPTSDEPTSTPTSTPTTTLKAGSVVTSPQGVEMVFCPAGSFTMGHEDEFDNQPRLEKIEKPFLLGKTEVTQKLYQKIMGSNPSYDKSNAQKPVEAVSWDDAIQFCNKLSAAEGLQLCYTKNSAVDFDWACDFSKNGYRLPTEKEWEYAAKASTDNLWPGTNDENKLAEYAWYKKNAGSETHPVGKLKPNGWGLYDMAGNLYEWCWDKYDPDDTDPSDSKNVRGGSGDEDSKYLTSATRFRTGPGQNAANIGFRLCRTFIQ